MKNLSIERLRAALAEEYPPGQVVLRAHDARALLDLLDQEAPAEDHQDGSLREPCCHIGPYGHEPGCPG